jgi:putative hydrolase of the HAD superfamily
MYKAVGFDLGETLVRYGHALSWQSLYQKALAAVGAACGTVPDERMLAAGAEVLLRYNTRANPRVEEVPADVILGEVLAAWQLPLHFTEASVEAFFSFFQRDTAVYPDVIPLLARLRTCGMKIGILTDAPYGMPREFVEQDIGPFARHVDVLLTSVEVGFRKPDPRGYHDLALRLGVTPAEMPYVGNEPKDMEGARRAGCLPVFLDRDGSSPHSGSLHVQSLDELAVLLQRQAVIASLTP